MRYLSIAVLLIFFGCSKEYTIMESIDGMILSANETTRIINQTTELKLVKNNGVDITSETVFYVNGIALSSNTFTKTETGTYLVEAKYQGFNASNTLEILYHDGSLVAFKSNVLVEDYTGVWCGNCPRVVHALNLATEQLGTNKNQLIKVAIHRSSNNPQDASYDPYNFDSSSFEPNGGYPKAYINRKTRWTPLEYNNLGMVINPTQINKKLGLKMNATVQNETIKLNVSGLFSENFEQTSLVVYVLESGFLYNQVNYTTFFGGVSVIPNFEQDHVLKTILTNANGDLISNSTLGSEFTRAFSIPVSNYTNIDKLEFVAFFVNNNGQVLNARACKINENQSFQFL